MQQCKLLFLSITNRIHYLLSIHNPEKSWVAFDLVLGANLAVLCAVQLSDGHGLVMLEGLGQNVPGWGKSLWEQKKSSVTIINFKKILIHTQKGSDCNQMFRLN